MKKELFDYRSIYFDSRNTEQNWIDSDTPSLLKFNLEHKKELVKKYQWDQIEIIYKFNSEGFRADEFSNNRGILFLGCSHTFGLALPNQYIWPTIVSNYFNLSCWNLGVSGASNDTCFRYGMHYIPKLLPKIVCILSPESSRIELVNSKKKKYYRFIINSDFVENKKYKDFYYDWATDETNIFLNRQKNLLGLENICKKLNIPFYCLNFEDMPDEGDFARDIHHYGIISQQKIAQRFISIIEI